MKHRQLLLFFLLCLTLFLALPAQAQESSPDLATLAVELWPDYDRPTVLVLITGSLAPTVALPATVTIPLPANADVHAVARISTTNTLVDDIVFEESDGAVTLTTPDSRFRVEYYLPYEQSGEDRSFAADWVFPFAVASVTVNVQEPAAATNFAISPAPQSVTTGQDGLTYHLLAPQTLAAGQPLEFDLTYTLADNVLTVETATEGDTASAPPASEPEQTTAASGNGNLPLILAGVGGLIISATLIWQGLRERSAQKSRPVVRRRPTPARPGPAHKQTPETPTGEARFCHQCGREASSDDRFCRQCGTLLKGRS